ncbi:GNAT family N-acetyltransferase [Kitasatospora sp. NPDC088783]|uniref:GNAT family N-acetyltransferase n=1 Tax=Kitasatospora sp. NPDC088783 TaxID=3364077 RepID=UPI0038255C33
MTTTAPAGLRTVTWELTPENDVPPELHHQMNALLRESFPYTTEQFRDGRSWAGARPERRLIGRIDGRPVAHTGLLRRFLRVGGTDQLVGEVGLVAVHPALQGTGVGREMADRTQAALAALRIPFGYLNCHTSVLGYYLSVGWTALDGTDTRHYEPDDELTALVTTARPMVLPVTAALTAWPAGTRIERDGIEL